MKCEGYHYGCSCRVEDKDRLARLEAVAQAAKAVVERYKAVPCLCAESSDTDHKDLAAALSRLEGGK